MKIAIITGETSGDLLGADLLQRLQQQNPSLEAAGIGGDQLSALTFDSWWSCEELAVFGIVEVLQHLPRLLKLRKQLYARLLNWRPDLVVTIDAPDFNLPLGCKLRKSGIRVVHYVCPSIWAWRPKRIKTLRRACEHVLCLLPFEADYLRSNDLSATFVGHPMSRRIPQVIDRQLLRENLGLDNDKKVIAIMPGSRNSELQRLLKPFLQTLQRLPTDLQVVAAAARPQHSEAIRSLYTELNIEQPLSIIDTHNEANIAPATQALLAADIALLASGTITLEALLCQCPMVVAYKLNTLTWQLLTKLGLYHAKYVSLPNLIADKKLVPELLQQQAEPEYLAPALNQLLDTGPHTLRQEFVDITAQMQTNKQHAGDVINKLLVRC